MDNEADATDAPSFPASNLEPGPVQPTDEVRKELQAYLAADSSRIGEVYRLLEEGLAPDAIADRLEGARPAHGSTGAWSGRCSTGTCPPPLPSPWRRPAGTVPCSRHRPCQLPPVHTCRRIWTNSSGAPTTPPAWTKKYSGPASKPSKPRPATRSASTSTPCRTTSGTPTTRPRAGRCSKAAAATATSSCGSAARPARPRSPKSPSCYGFTGPAEPRRGPLRQPSIACWTPPTTAAASARAPGESGSLPTPGSSTRSPGPSTSTSTSSTRVSLTTTDHALLAQEPSLQAMFERT